MHFARRASSESPGQAWRAGRAALEPLWGFFVSSLWSLWGCSGASLGHSGASRGPSGALLLASPGLSGHLCASLRFSKPLLASLGLSGLLCASLGISSHIWASLRLSGYRWACLGFSGPLLASLGLAWLLWQALFRSHSSCTFLMLSKASLGFLR